MLFEENLNGLGSVWAQLNGEGGLEGRTYLRERTVGGRTNHSAYTFVVSRTRTACSVRHKAISHFATSLMVSTERIPLSCLDG
jgi:hypothetical protein